MVEIGYKLSSEEHRPNDLVRYAAMAVHQIGPDQEGFLRFYERDVLPRLRKVRAAA